MTSECQGLGTHLVPQSREVSPLFGDEFAAVVDAHRRPLC